MRNRVTCPGNRCAPVVLRVLWHGLQPREELEPVASADGWTLTVTVNKVEHTPGGSKHVRQSETYNYKAGAEGESKELEAKRLEVKRNAKQRCLDKFDSAKMVAKKAKRLKRSKGREGAAATVAPATTLLREPAAVVQPQPAALESAEEDTATAAISNALDYLQQASNQMGEHLDEQTRTIDDVAVRSEKLNVRISNAERSAGR